MREGGIVQYLADVPCQVLVCVDKCIKFNLKGRKMSILAETEIMKLGKVDLNCKISKVSNTWWASRNMLH